VIDDLRILTSDYRKPEWSEAAREPGLFVVALTLTIEPRKVQGAQPPSVGNPHQGPIPGKWRSEHAQGHLRVADRRSW
jgi:hypothetical protein